MAFVNRVAEAAEAANHHPDIDIRWNKVRLALSTHSQGGLTSNDFAKNDQYGSLLSLTYLAFGGGGSTIQRYNDFRQVLSSNPCPASG